MSTKRYVGNLALDRGTRARADALVLGGTARPIERFGDRSRACVPNLRERVSPKRARWCLTGA